MTKQINLICKDDKIYDVNYSEISPFYGDYLNNIIELCDGNTENISINIPFIYEDVEIYGDVDIYGSNITFISTEIGAFFGSKTDYISCVVDQMYDLVEEPRYQLVGAIERFLNFCSRDEYCNKVLKYAESINNLKLIDVIDSYKLNCKPDHPQRFTIIDSRNNYDINIFEFCEYTHESHMLLYSTRAHYISRQNKMRMQSNIEIYESYGDDLENYVMGINDNVNHKLEEFIMRMDDIGIIIYYLRDKVYLFWWNKHDSITVMSYKSDTYDYKNNTIHHDKNKKYDALQYCLKAGYKGMYHNAIIIQLMSNSSCFDVTDYINYNDNYKHKIILPSRERLYENSVITFF